MKPHSLSMLLVVLGCQRSVPSPTPEASGTSAEVAAQSSKLNWREFEASSTDPGLPLPGDWGTGRKHFITRRSDGTDVVVFYMAEKPEATTKIDYELLDKTLTDADATHLIRWSYFHELTDDHYASTIKELLIGPLAGEHRRVPYRE